MSVIYKTTNLTNEKIYVGQDMYNKPEYLGSGKILKSAIKKYGPLNFQKIILEECSKELLNDREQYWIAFYDSMNPEIGYNLTSGGEGFKGSHTDFTRNKMSKSALNMSIEHKQKIKDKATGRPVSKETKKKMSDAAIGRILSNETKKKMSNAKQNMTDETKNKISKSKSGHSTSDETRLKISNALKGRKYSKRQ